MSSIVSPQPPKPRPRPPAQFEYGWRDVYQLGPDGKEERVRIPLTADDVLHPQEGDVIVESNWQEQERGYLANVFRSRTRGRPITVFSDLLIQWGIPGLRDHSPDLSAFEGVKDPEKVRHSLDVVPEGAMVRFTGEIVTPRDYDPQARENDTVTKFDHYHRAGVPVYLIVDQEREDGPRRVLAYRYTPQDYVDIPPDNRGRIYLDLFDVWIGIGDDNRVVCYDPATDEAIPEPATAYQTLEGAETARRAAEQQCQAETEARLAAEQQAQAEAAARLAADQQRQAEAEARKAAEQQAREAQARAEAEAQARAALEARLRELEAKLQGQGGPPAGSSPTS